MDNLLQDIMNLQAESGENIWWSDGSLTPVHAKDTHRAMQSRGDGDMVTDHLPGDAFIFSDHTRISRNDAKEMTIGIKRYPYEEYKKGKEPELFTLEDIFKKKEKSKSPAKLAERVRSKFPVIGTDACDEIDMFDAKTDQANKQNRIPYFEGIAALAETEAFKEETLEDQGEVELIPNFKRGGKVYSKNVDKAQSFLDITRAAASSLPIVGDTFGAIIDDANARRRQEELQALREEYATADAARRTEIEATFDNLIDQRQAFFDRTTDNIGNLNTQLADLINTGFDQRQGLLDNTLATNVNTISGLNTDLRNARNVLDFTVGNNIDNLETGLNSNLATLRGDLSNANALGLSADIFGATAGPGPAQRADISFQNQIDALNRADQQTNASNSRRLDIARANLVKTGDPIADALAQAQVATGIGQSSGFDPSFGIQAASLLDTQGNTNIDRQFANQSDLVADANNRIQGVAGGIGNFAGRQASNATLTSGIEANNLNNIAGQQNQLANTLFGADTSRASQIANLTLNNDQFGFTAGDNLIAGRSLADQQLAADTYNLLFNADQDLVNSTQGLNLAQLQSIQELLDSSRQTNLNLLGAEFGFDPVFSGRSMLSTQDALNIVGALV